MAAKDFTERDAAQLTGASAKDVAKAWHDAREHAQLAGELPERLCQKTRKVLTGEGIPIGRDDISARGGHVEIRSDTLHRLRATDPSRAAEIVHAIEHRVSGITRVSVRPEQRKL